MGGGGQRIRNITYASSSQNVFVSVLRVPYTTFLCYRTDLLFTLFLEFSPIQNPYLSSLWIIWAAGHFKTFCVKKKHIIKFKVIADFQRQNLVVVFSSLS